MPVAPADPNVDIYQTQVPNPYIYRAEVDRVIDGDTVSFRLVQSFRFTVDFGFHIKDAMSLTKQTTQSFRLYGINTPETVGATKPAGLAAKAETQRLLGLGEVFIKSYKPDKYGRWLADVFVNVDRLPGDPIQTRDFTGWLHVNQKLIEGGFAVPFMVTP